VRESLLLTSEDQFAEHPMRFDDDIRTGRLISDTTLDPQDGGPDMNPSADTMKRSALSDTLNQRDRVERFTVDMSRETLLKGQRELLRAGGSIGWRGGGESLIGDLCPTIMSLSPTDRSPPDPLVDRVACRLIFDVNAYISEILGGGLSTHRVLANRSDQLSIGSENTGCYVKPKLIISCPSRAVRDRISADLMCISTELCGL